jgi:S1-C subfamily serine protease
VSVDRAAAFQMVRRSGQQGVPVIIAGDDVVVGFDRRRLEQIVARYAQPASAAEGIKLGLVVRDAANGVEVGGVRPGALGERAGVRAGDVLESLAGQPIHSVAELEQRARTLAAGQEVDLGVRRQGQAIHLRVAS